MKRLGKYLIYTLLFVISGAVSGQSELKDLPEQINTNMVFEEGTYQLNGKCIVRKGNKLTLMPGVNILFGKGAEIVVEGALEISGKANKLVNLVSLDPDNPGKGIVIHGEDKSDLFVDYCRFKYLSKPFHAEKNWLRKDLTIKNSVFKFSEIYGAGIEINDIDNVLVEYPVSINLAYNTFSNNSGSILISNISSDYVSSKIIGNVITRNEYIGHDRNGMFTSPLFFTYNTSLSKQPPLFKNNSVFDNYSNLFLNDTLAVDYTNICVVGTADKLNVSNNYFGDPKNKEIEKTFDFVSANFMAPLLYYDQTEVKPSSELNGHFYKVGLNGDELSELIYFQTQKNSINHVELFFNRPVYPAENYLVKYYFLKDDTLFNKEIKHNLKWSDGNKSVKINLNDALLSKEKNGYLYIDGFFDENGMDVPALYVGKKQFLKNNELELVITNFLRKIARKDLHVKESKLAPTENDKKEKPTEEKIKELVLNYSKFDSTIDNTDTIIKVLKTNRFWEAGVFAGNALYWGDLVTTTIGLSLSNARPAIGLRARYHFSDNLQINFLANYMVIAGTDNKQTVLGKQRGTGYERGLSFRTYIFDVGSTIELDLIGYRSIKSFVPSLFAGVNVFNFTPTAEVDGKRYKLRPVGTEGQTLESASGTYAKWAFGIPVGFCVKRHWGQNNIFSLSYTYNKIFTDYLDDVSTGYYPDSSKLMLANPTLGETAVQLSNPNNQTGRRSSSSDFDGYGYWGITWTHKFIK